MKKKNIIIVIILILILILLSTLIFNEFFLNKKESNNKEYSYIKRKIDNNEDMILFLTYLNNDEYAANDFIKYYKEIYKLKIDTIDVSKLKKRELDKIISLVDEKEHFVIPPAVIFIKGGKSAAVANDIISESILYNFLYYNGYITDEEYNIQKELDNDNFMDVYSSSEGKLLFFTSNTQKNFSFRKKLYKISKENRLSFYINYWYIGKDDFSQILSKDYGKEIGYNNLVIVKNNKVIDNLETNNIDKLEDFLRKYGFIK